MKIILSFLMLILTGASSIAGNIVKIFEFNNPAIENSGLYSVISFEGTRLLGEPGKATLPFYPVKLLLPPGEIAISISIQFEKPVTIPGVFDLLPRQETRPLSEENSSKWLIDKDFYHNSKIYPLTDDPKVETHFFNGCGIALSAFTPLRYIPSKGEVSYFQRVIVTIQTAPDPLLVEHQLNFFPSEKKLNDLAGIVQNPGLISQYFSGRDFRTNEYDYLIVTSAQYLAEFDTLARFYKPRGIRTKAVSTEYISTTVSGADLQAKIRNYIIAEYQANGIEYVMIGGDTEVVPFRGFYCYVISGSGYEDYNIPADLYYSALDGNWNTDGDNRWGETDEDDLYPEIGMGRLTFSDTTELHNMLHKTMLYQADPVEGELTQPLLAGEHLWYPPKETWGSDYMRLLVGYRTDNGYTTHGIPPAHPRDTLYDSSTFTWSKTIMMNHINEGHPWVHHCGHANSSTVMKMSMSDITNANFSQANGVNHNFTIVYTHGCICGGFDYNDCIAEKMTGIDNFAVAFVGNSRYGWFVEGTTDGPSEHLHREFMDAIYHDSLYQIGMAHLKSKSETAPFVDLSDEYEPGATRWCFYDNNVLGDPMMACWTEEPHLLNAMYPALIPIGAGSISVQLNGLMGVYRNFTCCIYRNDTLFGTGKTNSTGNTDILLQDGLTEGPVSLVVSGNNILPQYFEIQVSNYWLGYNTDWNDAINWYTHVIPDSTSHVIIPANPAGSNFPVKNSNNYRYCKAIKIETGALFNVGSGETFSVGSE